MFKDSRSKIFNTFADAHDLVIFEDASKEEVHPLHGITFTPKHDDENFMHGNVDGVETSFLDRVSIYPAAGGSQVRQAWALGMFQLTANHSSHLYVNHIKHIDEVYRHIFQIYSHLQNVDAHLIYAPIRNFNVYANSSTTVHINQILSPQFVGHLNEHNNFDYEILQDKLFVYYAGALKNPELLDSMLSAGIKLTLDLDELESQVAT